MDSPIKPTNLKGEIGGLFENTSQKPSGDVSVFKSLGLAIQDMAAAELAFTWAEKFGLGQRVELSTMKYAIRTQVIPHFHNENIFLKPENLQPFGSYKIRGVENFFAKNLTELRRHGLIIASAGNMAQPVAYLAKKHDVDCKIVIPDSAPQTKKLKLKQLSRNIEERTFAEVWQMVCEHTTHIGERLFLHPALQEDLIAGYGIIAQELIDELPKIDAIVVPFGVGGLIRGIAERARKLKPELKIYACEVATAAPLAEALKVGAPTQISRQKTIVDAIGTPQVIAPVWKKLAPLIAGSLVVDVPEVEQALVQLYFEHRMVIEGAGAVALAAAKKLASQAPHQQIATVLSGGNLDLKILHSLSRTTD